MDTFDKLKDKLSEAKEELNKRAPKGVDPEKHENCVHDVKAQGHDVGSAHAICSSSMKKDEIDEKIKAKMKAEMDRRNIGGKEIADHYRDIDETIPAKQRSNIKSGIKNQNKPKLTIAKTGQWSMEKNIGIASGDSHNTEIHRIKSVGVLKTDKNGQWSMEKGAAEDLRAKYIKPKEPSMEERVKQIKAENADPKEPDTDTKIKQLKAKNIHLLKEEMEKDNSVKPFGESVYNSAANVGRKMSRTGEVRESVGRNEAVREYTNPQGTAKEQAARQAKLDSEKNKKQPVKSLKDMSPEEREAIKKKYELVKSIMGWKYNDATGNFNHRIHGAAKIRTKEGTAGGYEVVHNGEIISSHGPEDRQGAIKSLTSHIKKLK